MLHDSDQKLKRRDDAIYNPIEGKWEKRSARTIDNTNRFKLENKLKLEDIKTAVNGLVKDTAERSSTPREETPLSSLKRIADIPVKKLKDSMHQQEMHDRKVLKMSEDEYQEVKKGDSFLIIKIAIGLLLLFMASRT